VQAESDRLAARSRELRSRFDAALTDFAEDRLLDARDGFEAVLALAPDDPDASAMLQRTHATMTRRASGLAGEGAAFAQADRLDHARQRLDQARNLDPEAPGLAAAELALRHAERRAEAPPAQAASNEATTIALAGTATTAPSPAIGPERRRELDDLYRRGVAALADDRRDEAVRYWEVVWAADPDHHQVRESLGREYLTRGMEAYATGDLQAAIDRWQEARRVDPTDARALGYLERAQQQLARMEQINRGR